MARLGAVHSVGESVAAYLGAAHQLQRQVEAVLPVGERVLPDCRFSQVSGAKLAANFAPAGNELTLHLYRVGIDPLMRTTPDPRTPQLSHSRPLSLELHYLMTVWCADASDEQTLLAFAMRELHMRPAFDRSRLSPARVWEADETVQVVLSEISHEDMMRIWDALDVGYRLSVSYVARVVRVESTIPVAAEPVVATRFDVTELKALDVD